MSAIRPELPPVPSVNTPAAPQLHAAQAAFFRAALDQATATTAIAQTQSAGEAVSPRAQRPGALLDIRV